MSRRAGLAIAALLILTGQTLWSGTASAGDPPEFWQADDVVVRVVDIPDTALFKRGYNNYVDLGYHFRPDGSGEWVGYLSKGRPERLDMIRLGMMLNAAGLDRIPPVPDRPASTATYTFFIANGLLQLGLLLRILLNQNNETRTQVKKVSTARQARRSLFQKLEAELTGKAKRGDGQQAEATATLTAEPAVVQRGIMAAVKAKAAFGRRGIQG